MTRVFLTAGATACSTEATLIDDVAFPQYVHWFGDSYDRVGMGLHYPPHRVAQRVLTPAVREHCRQAAERGGRSAFILAAGNTNFVGLNPRKFQADCRFAYTYRLPPLSLTNIYGARVAQDLGCADYIATDATACVSALKALMDALALIRVHGYERVAILAVEDQVNTVMLEFFGEAKACLTLAEMQEGALAPSAFDPVNRGFFIGQGAAFALLESERSAQGGTTAPIAAIKSAVVLAERHSNAMGQREDGAGYRDAITHALALADATPGSIDLVKTHGTGTASNNQAEANGIEAALGRDFVATSYKQRIGHTMGASGLLELLLALDDAGQGVARGIPNRTGGDPRYLMADREMDVRRLLVLASGMGNVFGATICDRL